MKVVATSPTLTNTEIMRYNKYMPGVPRKTIKEKMSSTIHILLPTTKKSSKLLIKVVADPFLLLQPTWSTHYSLSLMFGRCSRPSRVYSARQNSQNKFFQNCKLSVSLVKTSFLFSRDTLLNDDPVKTGLQRKLGPCFRACQPGDEVSIHLKHFTLHSAVLHTQMRDGVLNWPE